jgi:hypothetical protein
MRKIQIKSESIFSVIRVFRGQFILGVCLTGE